MIEIEAMFPVMVTPNIETVKQFYESVFGFKAVFYEPDFYVHLISPSGIQLGFLVPNHPSQPEFLHANLSVNGYVISLEVQDAAYAYAEAKKMNLSFAMDLKQESWGQTHFMLQDPAGFYIDVVEHTKPAQ